MVSPGFLVLVLGFQVSMINAKNIQLLQGGLGVTAFVSHIPRKYHLAMTDDQ